MLAGANFYSCCRALFLVHAVIASVGTAVDIFLLWLHSGVVVVVVVPMVLLLLLGKTPKLFEHVFCT